MSVQHVLNAPSHRFVRRQVDWKVIGLVGLVHATSHFFQLVLAALFVPLGKEFNIGFAELGALVAVFYFTSGVGQAFAGFVVDRVGSRPVLWFGLSCFVLSAVLLGSASAYHGLMIAAFVAGLGNCVFHPVDYSILNRRVSTPRLGHAFSAHSITGNIGWAASPVFITTLTYLFNWRVAAFGAAVAAAIVLALALLGRRLLAGLERPKAAAPATRSPRPAAAPGTSVLALLSNPVVWGAFLFFVFSSGASSAVQNYTLPILGNLYGISAVGASTALSGYLIAGAAGMVAGGFLVSSGPYNERIVALSFLGAGSLLAVVGMGWVAAGLAIPCVVLAGFCAGIAAPSRDMLVRRVAPKGAIASVYGLVGSGMDTGSAVAPLVFGLMMDAGLRQGPYLGAFFSFLTSAGFAALIAARARKYA